MATESFTHTLYEEDGRLLVSSRYEAGEEEEDENGIYYYPSWEVVTPFTEWALEANYVDWEYLEYKTKHDLTGQVSFKIKSIKEEHSFNMIYGDNLNWWHRHYRRYGKPLYVMLRLLTKYPATLSVRVIRNVQEAYYRVDRNFRWWKIKERLRTIPIMVKIFPSLNIIDDDLPF